MGSPGDSSWKDTGLADTDDPSEDDLAQMGSG